MKTTITLLLAIVLLSSCGALEEFTKSSKSEKTSKTKEDIRRDSAHTVFETPSSLNTVVLDAKDFHLRGDFTQEVESGKGNKTSITKKGDKVTIKTANSGSKKSETKVNNSKEKTVYNAEFIISETKKVIRRVPLRYKFYIALALLIWQRKFVSQLIVSLFPGMGTKRLIKLFLGKNI